MIELNLLPDELKKKRKKIELPELPLIPIAAGLVGALIIIQFILSGLVFLSRHQLQSLEKKWTNLAPQKKELDKIKNNITQINRKTDAIETLIAEQTSWSLILNELSTSLPANIWLTELVYNEKSEKISEAPPARRDAASNAKRTRSKRQVTKVRLVRTLTLSGVASGKGEEATAQVARFIRALKGNEKFFKDFESVELVSIKQGAFDGQDVMNFTLVCQFNEEDAG